MLFTMLKIAFVGGAVGTVASLSDAVDTARQASSVELHTTTIRNEAAYFGCVTRVGAPNHLEDNDDIVIAHVDLPGCLLVNWETDANT
jgi:hypothetical protein